MSTLGNLLAQADLQAVVEHSFKDFHAKGLDYICLKRTPEYTVKVYLFDGDASTLPEVVNPHDHRYVFRTTVIRGKLFDYGYIQDESGEPWQAFDYMTPLNGGNGFTYRGTEGLSLNSVGTISQGSSLITRTDQVHTICTGADQTMVLLEQYGDLVALDAPTSLWCRSGDPTPVQTGLYSKFTEDEASQRLALIQSTLG
jgi:hypothetical protein